jgi:hypothetical protein
MIIGILFIPISAILLYQFYQLKKVGYERNSPEYLKAAFYSSFGFILMVFGIINIILIFDT